MEALFFYDKYNPRFYATLVLMRPIVCTLGDRRYFLHPWSSVVEAPAVFSTLGQPHHCSAVFFKSVHGKPNLLAASLVLEKALPPQIMPNNKRHAVLGGAQFLEADSKLPSRHGPTEPRKNRLSLSRQTTHVSACAVDPERETGRKAC
uniref:Uncharacterized protein n=1 Tax=Helicotheca tamesis TaxID=374047 RepID=A0A7S2HM86_9STRA|mmetsp:Transcript_19409/g.26638  ORF Transcript_19409/g.26638 Transcript_19409/m.26638 type:complete len:148 (+) Transcript_19409:698-1141(+)